MRSYFARLGTLTYARLPYGLGFCVLAWALDVARSQAVVSSLGDWSIAIWLNAHYSAVQAPLVFAALLFAQALPLRGAARFFTTLLLVVGAESGALAILAQLHQGGGLVQDDIVALHLIDDTGFIWRNLWVYTALAMLLDTYFAQREKQASLAEAVRKAEAELARRRCAVAALRLKALQARVDPELLFEVLDEACRRYDQHPAAADRLIADTVAYLRSALPDLHGEASTLGREVALVEAYLKIVAAGRDGRLSMKAQIPAALTELPFPSMILLPLVQSAAVDASRSSAVVEARRSWSDWDQADEIVVTITVRPPGLPPGWSDERIDGIRDRLGSCFGEASALDIVAAADRSSVELRWIARDQRMESLIGAVRAA